MLPGWYGFGSAVAQWIADHPTDGLARLQRMHDDWPFFRTTLVQHGHGAGQDRHRASPSRYAELVGDERLRQHDLRPHPRRMAELHRRRALDQRQGELLEGNPLLARSIRSRFPYIDPLNHLQIELLRRHRAGDTDPGVVQGIHLSINGIAAGLRNSG